MSGNELVIGSYVLSNEWVLFIFIFYRQEYVVKTSRNTWFRSCCWVCS